MIPLERQALVLISGPDDDGPTDDNISRDDLTGCRLIVSQRGSLMRALVDDVLASGIEVSIVAEIAHRTSILPMVLNGLGRAVMPASWTATARRSGARVQTITPQTYLHVAAVSRRTHLTTPATALMIEARRTQRKPAPLITLRHGENQARTADSPFTTDEVSSIRSTTLVCRSGPGADASQWSACDRGLPSRLHRHPPWCRPVRPHPHRRPDLRVHPLRQQRAPMVWAAAIAPRPIASCRPTCDNSTEHVASEYDN